MWTLEGRSPKRHAREGSLWSPRDPGRAAVGLSPRGSVYITHSLPSGTLPLDCCRDVCLGLVLWAGELMMEWHTSLLGWNVIFSDCSVWGVLASDHSVSCSSDERICHVVKAQIWELEDLATVPEAATAYLWFWKRQRMTDIRWSIFQWLNDSMGLSLLTSLGTLYFTLSIKHIGSSNNLYKKKCMLPAV